MSNGALIPAETGLQRSALIEECLEALSDGVALLDRNGTFVYGNQRYCEMFFDPGDYPKPGESAIEVVRRLVAGNRVYGLDQVEPEFAVLNCLIDCFSFVQRAEFALKDGSVIQVSSTPTKSAGYLMTFHDTGPDRLGERRAAELLDSAFSSAEQGMVLWDAALTVLLVNAAWKDLALPIRIGENVGEMFERFCAEGMLVNSSSQPDAAFVRDCLSRMHKGPTQWLLRHRDGRRIQLATFGTNSGGVMATAVDVTAQHDAQDRATRLLRDAVEALAIGVLHFDEHLTLQMMNRAAHQIIMPDLPLPEEGITLQALLNELIAHGHLPLAPGRDCTDVIAEFVAAAHDCLKSQRLRWAHGRTVEFNVEPTKLGGYLISVQDLTGAVTAQRAAQEAHELVTTIVDASPTTFLVSTVETGEVIYATEASRERFGGIKSTLAFFLDPDHRRAYLDALLPTGRLDDYPVRFKRQDGTIMDGLTSARVIDYKGEKMIVSSTRDITDFLAMQRELEDQRRVALQTEKLSALGELLAGVAHELSNPLSVVVGYAMMLREEVTDPSLLKKLDRIESAADRCVRIVKMFLSMAREKPAVVAPCDVRDLLDAALAVSHLGTGTQDASLRLDIPDDLPPISADADHITQVFANLISNAIHATDALGGTGCISIRARAELVDEKVVVEVEDNGDGIPLDIQSRVFDPFFTTKDIGNGTGVGLAFSHRVVSAHGGVLTLASPAEGGALFSMALPVGRPVTPHPTASARDATTGNSYRILVLDNDPGVLDLLKDMLVRAGHSVHTCDSAHDALELCSAQGFDVILSDIRMPDMDGGQFYAALQQIDAAQAAGLIYLSGDTMNTGILDFVRELGRPLVEKPIIASDVLAQVETTARQEAP